MRRSTVARGRPRSEASRRAILAATFDALVSRGYESISIESLARAAGVGKATVYRWWPTKADLAVESFFLATQNDLTMPSTGSAKEDFRLQILSIAHLLQGPRGRALAGMLGGARSDPTLSKALNERWLRPRRAWGAARMRKAISNRETRRDIKVGPALALLYSPLYTPLLFGEAVPTIDFMEEVLKLSLECVFSAA